MIKKTLLTLIISMMFLGCAKVTSPTGGPKDTIPPILIKTYPAKQAKNFKASELTLEFSEYIQLNNPKEQIIITPDINKKYMPTAKRNKLIISLEEPLQDSTTYSINFRETVQDITEKNPARNLKLAFSTGPYIDSLSIQGTVTNLLTNKETKDITIALYQADTFSIFKNKPAYLTKSDDKGRFLIENLKHGKFYLFAFDDKNKNLIVDSKNEIYGYLAEPIDLQQNQRNKHIGIIKLDARPLKLTSLRPYNTYFNIKAAKGLSKYTISSKEPLYTIMTADAQNIKVFNTFLKTDSLHVNLSAYDSIGNQIDSSFYIKFTTRETKPENFSVEATSAKALQTKARIEATINVNKPIALINTDSIYYKIDSLNIVRFTLQDFTIDSTRGTIQLTKTFDKKMLPSEEQPTQNPADKNKPKSWPKDYELHIGKGTFISVESDTSAQLTQKLKPLKLEDMGVIFAEVQTTAPNFILQLLDKDFKVIRSITNQKKVTFDDLVPAEYQLRIIIDTDGNQQWSPGDFHKHIEPEKAFFYRNEKGLQLINLRANFELGPLLIKA